MTNNRAKVIILHNVVAPYRLPLFSELSKSCDLLVFFCSQKADGRNWNTDISQRNFRYKFLKRISVSFFVFNPTLVFHLLKYKSDLYILIDNEENAFSNLITLWVAKLTNKPYVLWSGHISIERSTIHPIDFHSGLMHRRPIKDAFVFFIRRINKYLYDNAASYLAYSNKSKDYLIMHGVDTKKIFVGTQAMSPSLMPLPTKKLKLNSKKLQLLYLGYLRPEKGVEALLEVVLKLPVSKLELHIVGDGPEKPGLQKRVGKNHNIRFHPYAHPQDRANWYSSVDMTILPTYYDPWAHTVTESLYYGTPVIVTTSAAASESIESGKNGFTYEAGNKNALRSILDGILKNSIILEGMKNYTKSCRNIRLYDVPSDAKNIMSAINHALL